MNSQPKNAIFLDRDGTINEDVGDFCTSDKLLFIPELAAKPDFIANNIYEAALFIDGKLNN